MKTIGRLRPIPLHFRFRTSSLLWLTVVVAAFFLGRQSDEIARRLSQLRISFWPDTSMYILSNSLYTLSKQSDGSLLFAARSPSPSLRILINGTACDIQGAGSNRFQLAALRDGTTEIEILKSDGSGALVKLDVKGGKFASTAERRIPAKRPDTAQIRGR
jgi:hypothetical protein